MGEFSLDGQKGVALAFPHPSVDGTLVKPAFVGVFGSLRIHFTEC